MQVVCAVVAALVHVLAPVPPQAVHPPLVFKKFPSLQLRTVITCLTAHAVALVSKCADVAS